MESTEEMATRRAMVDMHSFFLEKIDEAINGKNEIEASWLIYACLENRYYRILLKYKRNCKYCKKGSKCRKASNQLALSTKISCVERLLQADVKCISDSFTRELLRSTRCWVKRRNKMTHELLSLEKYREAYDRSFSELAEEGRRLLSETYDACTKFRALFYSPEYSFEFPEECMEQCLCAKSKQSEQ